MRPHERSLSVRRALDHCGLITTCSSFLSLTKIASPETIKPYIGRPLGGLLFASVSMEREMAVFKYVVCLVLWSAFVTPFSTVVYKHLTSAEPTFADRWNDFDPVRQ